MLADNVASICLETDDIGAVVERYAYDPLGPLCFDPSSDRSLSLESYPITPVALVPRIPTPMMA